MIFYLNCSFSAVKKSLSPESFLLFISFSLLVDALTCVSVRGCLPASKTLPVAGPRQMIFGVSFEVSGTVGESARIGRLQRWQPIGELRGPEPRLWRRPLNSQWSLHPIASTVADQHCEMISAMLNLR
jgi:hypothetical protein